MFSCPGAPHAPSPTVTPRPRGASPGLATAELRGSGAGEVMVDDPQVPKIQKQELGGLMHG